MIHPQACPLYDTLSESGEQDSNASNPNFSLGLLSMNTTYETINLRKCVNHYNRSEAF